MGNIDLMRKSLLQIYVGMDIEEFISFVGSPDSIEKISSNTTYFIWDSPVWKGIFRGGNVHRKITIQVQNGKVVSWSSENLERSNW